MLPQLWCVRSWSNFSEPWVASHNKAIEEHRRRDISVPLLFSRVSVPRKARSSCTPLLIRASAEEEIPLKRAAKNSKRAILHPNEFELDAKYAYLPDVEHDLDFKDKIPTRRWEKYYCIVANTIIVTLYLFKTRIKQQLFIAADL